MEFYYQVVIVQLDSQQKTTLELFHHVDFPPILSSYQVHFFYYLIDLQYN